MMPSSTPFAVESADPETAQEDPHEPGWLAGGQIPSLNGLRAISILLVIVSHLSHQGQIVPRAGAWAHLGLLGRLGVDMFFVISGFLITLLLLREYERHQTISLKQFYLRRAFRILPAYVCFLLGIGVLCFLGLVVLQAKDWIGVLTYTVSFIYKPSWDINHIWTLSVEEHFYFLWPVAVCLWPRRAWMLAVATILATPLLRWIIQNHVPLLDEGYCSLTRMDTIAVGCCLAYLAVRPGFRRAMSGLVRNGYVASIVLVAIVGLSIRLTVKFPVYEMVLHPFVIACAYAVTIWVWTVRDASLLGRVLNSKPATVVGLLSYSIYLWQQPFLSPYSSAWFAQSPVNLVLIAGLAVGSYLLVESPMLRLKDRLSLRPRPTPPVNLATTPA